ncbi:MAG TPA: S8 family serine peptidase [Blastocatellia bacterium]|nr:S8 family serine peptidase [Blastocatellia bacterium]
MRKAASPRFAVLFSILLILHSTITAFAGIQLIPGQGVVLTGADGVVLTGADGVVLTGADGVVLTGADGVVLTGADGVVLTGADAFTYTGAEGVVLTGADSSGIQSFDPELAFLLENLPDSSAINVFIVFHQMPTDADLSALQAAGILGGTRFHNLPMVMVNATKSQIAAVSALPSVRSIYSNKTFEFFTHDTREIIGQKSIVTDANLTRKNGGLPIAGQGITVAVLDTGIDATHPDLAYGTQVVQNVRVEDLQGASPAFLYPIVAEGLRDTDLALGHGTFVASIIAGTGSASGGYYGGMAPGARLLGVSCGDASLFYVLSGIDYILSHYLEQNIRVVNCSWGISGLFDANDPVNIATKIMHDAGITVVFSAGNRGNTANALNPYSVADWVIGVGSGTKSGSLSSFSSRGAAGYAMFHPTLIAPGENIVAARATGINVVGTAGLSAGLISADNDLKTISPAYLPRYTTSSGTSFAAPHVAATVAMMLQANPSLTPDQIKTILQETATPMLGYSLSEVGAGYLNAYAAVREAAFGTRYGLFRSGLLSKVFALARQPIASFNGEVAPGQSYSQPLDVPSDTIFLNVQAGWVRAIGEGNNLEVALSYAGQTVTSNTQTQLAGSAFKKAGVTVTDPASGRWMITVTNTSDPVRGSSQKFNGAIEIIRATYSMTGLDGLSPSQQQAIKRVLRAGIMTVQSNNFGGGTKATRLEAARAVMLAAGARVPQYLPYAPTFTDVANDASAVFVESVTHSRRGDLFATSGTSFNPQAAISRLTVAAAMVKVLWSDDEIQAASVSNPGLADWDLIPLASRGFVSLAVSSGLFRPDAQGYFRPNDSITRLELALAAAALQQAAR